MSNEKKNRERTSSRWQETQLSANIREVEITLVVAYIEREHAPTERERSFVDIPTGTVVSATYNCLLRILE